MSTEIQEPAAESQNQEPAAQSPESSSENSFETLFTEAANSSSNDGVETAPVEVQPNQPGEQQLEAPRTPVVDQGGVDSGGSSPLVQQALSLGIEIDETASSEQLAQAVIAYAQQQQPYAQYGQGLMPHAQQINEYFNSANKPQQTPGQPEAEKPDPVQNAQDEWNPQKYFAEKWNAPAMKPEHQRMIDDGLVQTDDNGRIVAAPGYESVVAPYLPDINTALSARQQNWRELMGTNPYEKFYDVLKEPLLKSIQQSIEEQVESRLSKSAEQAQQEKSQQQAQQQLSDFDEKNSDWLYEKDAQGKIIGGETGKPLMTKQGQAFVKQYQDLYQRGITDEKTLLELSMRLVGPQQVNQPASAAPQQPAAQVKTPEQANQEAQESFLETAKKKAMHSPQQGSAPMGSPDTPVHVSKGELDNLFINAFAQASGQQV